MTTTKNIRQTFQQSLTVINRLEPFYRLDNGDCFALPGTIGFGEIWI